MEICDIAELDWEKSESEDERKSTELVINFAIIEFCISLRGEEVPIAVIDGIFYPSKRPRHTKFPTSW